MEGVLQETHRTHLMLYAKNTHTTSAHARQLALVLTALLKTRADGAVTSLAPATTLHLPPNANHLVMNALLLFLAVLEIATLVDTDHFPIALGAFFTILADKHNLASPRAPHQQTATLSVEVDALIHCLEAKSLESYLVFCWSLVWVVLLLSSFTARDNELLLNVFFK